MADGVDFLLKGYDQYDVLLGDELRGERATMGKSLLDVQRDLKIKASYIAAIENCDLQVFSNRGFVAGYVRSYARYLNLDPETIYERFCAESGFIVNDSAQDFQITKQKNKNPKKYFGEKSNWKPNTIGIETDKTPSVLDITSKLLPIICLLFVIFGVSFGAYGVLQDIQKLEIVAGDDAPFITTDNNIDISAKELVAKDFTIYQSKELSLPVLSPRDGPLSELLPERITALENRSTYPSDILTTLADTQENVETTENIRVFVAKPDPVVRTSPVLPKLRLFALTPAWVRLTNEEGIVVFEKILNARETFTIEKALFSGTLRAGNATNVYFFIDGKALGPLSQLKSVAKNVSLDPEIIKSKWQFSKAITTLFLSGDEEEIFLDTAQKLD